jgi:hypothetical protein
MLRPVTEPPEATLETELHLTNDAEWSCPSCGDPEGAMSILGDATIPTENAIPGAVRVAKWLAQSSDDYCFHYRLEVYECCNCAAHCYFLNLAVVNSPEISADWADRYFWQNKPYDGVPELYGVELHPPLPGVPERWIMARLELDLGLIFDWHSFGPFPAGDDVEELDDDGFYRAEGKPWRDAETLLARVWPAITHAVVINDADEEFDDDEEIDG